MDIINSLLDALIFKPISFVCNYFTSIFSSNSYLFIFFAILFILCIISSFFRFFNTFRSSDNRDDKE